MYLLLPSLLILHLADLLLLYISTIDNTWWMYKEGRTGDLWQQCSYSDAERTWICGSAMVTSGGEWQHAVQALMVLAVLFSSLSFLIFVCQLYTLRRGSLFYVTGLFQIFSGLCVLTAPLIYTLHVHEFHADKEGTFGYSYILAWVVFPITLASGIMYIHLRKLE
ncbi:peripheral myelin protein 22-like isoform X1 [Heptranchias perlo]|uniref:peripheral myelin protein 22-like isoform X1 n=2 Tax=Heptranchias perlo TaxID=212740 RepID=UPI00355A1BB1